MFTINNNNLAPQALIALFFLLLALSGCDITQPDRFYDKSADKDPAFDLYVTGLPSDGHIAVSKTITLNFISSTDSVKELHIYLDDVYDRTLNRYPYKYYIDPSSLTAGKHELKIYVVAANKGLYTAVSASQLLYTVPFYYDTTPPKDVVVNPIVYKNGHPYLSWSKSADPDFKSYRISYSNKYNTNINDTINDGNKTWYADTSTSLIYGRNFMSYKVCVYNGAKYSVGVNVDLSWGTEIPKSYQSLYLVNNSYNLMYFVYGTSLSAASTLTNTLVKNVSLDPPDVGQLKYLCLSPDNTKLYIVCQQNLSGNANIYVYDSQSLILLRTIQTNVAGSARIAVTNDRFYLATTQNAYIINPADGSTINSCAVTSLEINKIFIDAPNNLLYNFNEFYTSEFDVSNDSIKLVKKVRFDNDASIPSDISFFKNRFYILDLYHSVKVLDSKSLDVINSLSFSGTSVPNDISVSNGYLYVGTQENSGKYMGRVYKYLADDLSLKDTFIFTDYIKCTSASPDGKYLYAGLTHYNEWSSWFVVPLNN
jgi:hypothetical protein